MVVAKPWLLYRTTLIALNTNEHCVFSTRGQHRNKSLSIRSFGRTDPTRTCRCYSIYLFTCYPMSMTFIIIFFLHSLFSSNKHMKSQLKFLLSCNSGLDFSFLRAKRSAVTLDNIQSGNLALRTCTATTWSQERKSKKWRRRRRTFTFPGQRLWSSD